MKRPAAAEAAPEAAPEAKKPTLASKELPLGALRSGLPGSYPEQLEALQQAAEELMNHWDLWMLGGLRVA